MLSNVGRYALDRPNRLSLRSADGSIKLVYSSSAAGGEGRTPTTLPETGIDGTVAVVAALASMCLAAGAVVRRQASSPAKRAL